MNLRWKKISNQEIRINRFRSFQKKTFRLPNGHIDDFYTIGRSRIVCALVITPSRKVVLAKQFRPGVEKIMWELPGGGINKHESPKQAIAREVFEETGYAGTVQLIGQSTNDGWADKWRYHFLITKAKKIGHPKPEITEPIQVVTVPMSQFRKLIRQGRLTDAETAYRGFEALRILRWKK